MCENTHPNQSGMKKQNVLTPGFPIKKIVRG